MIDIEIRDITSLQPIIKNELIDLKEKFKAGCDAPFLRHVSEIILSQPAVCKAYRDAASELGIHILTFFDTEIIISSEEMVADGEYQFKSFVGTDSYIYINNYPFLFKEPLFTAMNKFPDNIKKSRRLYRKLSKKIYDKSFR